MCQSVCLFSCQYDDVKDMKCINTKICRTNEIPKANGINFG